MVYNSHAYTEMYNSNIYTQLKTLFRVAWFLVVVRLHKASCFVCNLPLPEAEKKAVTFIPLVQGVIWFFKKGFTLLVPAFYNFKRFPMKNNMACRLW